MEEVRCGQVIEEKGEWRQARGPGEGQGTGLVLGKSISHLPAKGAEAEEGAAVRKPAPETEGNLSEAISPKAHYQDVNHAGRDVAWQDRGTGNVVKHRVLSGVRCLRVLYTFAGPERRGDLRSASRDGGAGHS